METTFGQLIAHVTGGRRYCFVVMSYHEGFAFFKRIRDIVGEETGFECIRADDIPRSGEDLRDKIHAAIDNAVLVVADISKPSPNIYYEVGYSAARGRPMLLLARQNVKIPTDLAGLEVIRYIDTSEGIPRFEDTLRRYLGIYRDSNVSLLRAMLLPQHPSPSYIVTDPKSASPKSRFQLHPRERWTWGDYLGVAGILGAFGSVYGEFVVPELLSASHVAQFAEEEGALHWDGNFYLIGSLKSNKLAGQFLAAVQRGRAPNWRFGRCPGEENEVDYQVRLAGDYGPGGFLSECLRSGEVRDSYQDWGLLVRGPHPQYPQRLVTILAGPHSLGTGAACLAATKTPLIRTIAERLAGRLDLAARDRALWVLVRGTVKADAPLEAGQVEIVDAGVYAV